MANNVVGADLKTARGVAAARGIERLQPDLVAYIPSNVVAPIIAYLQDHPIKLMVIAREEEAVGIVGGAALAGRTGVIVMQDNGFGNALTALATFPVAYHLPLLIVANTRGGLGEYNSMIHTISEGVPAILRAIDIPVFHLDRTHSILDWEQTVFEAGRHAAMTHRPVVVLMDFWGNEGGLE
jgi:sulfopyruvate decarboxylase subunit alpha